MSKFFAFNMFFLSFSPLWVSILFVDLKSIFIDKNESIITEIILIALIILLWLISFIVLCSHLHKTNNINSEYYTIKEAREGKTITSDFFLSYILPLFAFEFTQWDGVVEFLIFFCVLAFLCIRHNHFSVNIVLELMNYKMYECVLQNSDDQEIERIVISKESLTVCKGKGITVKHINNDFVQMMS